MTLSVVRALAPAALVFRVFLALLAIGAAAAPARATGTPEVAAVAKVYADIAEAAYSDSHAEALKLKSAIDKLLAEPSEVNLTAARKAWVAARIPYMQTEVYRFGNKIVDDWEGKVNAWPLDEGLIDYVAEAYGTESGENAFYAANVIANKKFKAAGKSIDAARITKELLVRNLHEADGIEANVATGYHAIEFLLWGQDLNGTGPGAGNRPASDFDPKNCTGGNCDRRAAYLRVVTELLVDQLAWMKGQWNKVGQARKELGTGNTALGAIFTGLGSLTYGELAGERMKLGLLLHDPEEEHDCFSDQTHLSHFYNLAGIRNVYLGNYMRLDGQAVTGTSISDLVKAKSPETDAEIRAAIDTSMDKMKVLFDRAEKGEAYDQMISEDNAKGNAVVQAAIDALVAQAQALEKAIAALGLEGITFEGSDSLDQPAKVDRG